MLRYLSPVFCFLGFCLVNSWSPVAQANNSCDYHQQRLDSYNQKRRAGGSSRQMNDWLRKRNYHRAQLAECIRSARSQNIQTTGGARQRRYDDRQAEIKITATDARVVRLYQTCNFWIREHNRHATGDTLAQRNSACRIARNAENEQYTASSDTPVHSRSLKDCVKPGNLIDNDVSACLQGKLTPDWNENWEIEPAN